MFIHGRLFLTTNHIMLDEVRSLLQKSLRRKEWVFALQSTKELLGYEKDQLPWKSILTYLFEDHCLSDTDVLMQIYKATQDKSKTAKYTCVELLLQCKTCRIAACLPVIALDSPYEPKKWDSSITVDDEIKGLMLHTEGLMNTDMILAHLLEAWKANNHEAIITYMKLATMVVDNEKRQLTSKGIKYLISSQIKKPNFGQIVLSMLYKNTDDPTMRGYIAACHRLSSVPEVCIRLILYAPVTRLMFSKFVSGIPEKRKARVDWKTVRRLKFMPGWAIDKHTFRGKFGRDTKCLIKKKPSGMSDEEYEEFHGLREKKGLDSFFTEGVQCAQEAVSENPYWDRTTEIYFTHSPKKQKTAYMTAEYYKLLKKKYPKIFEVKTEVFFGRRDSADSGDNGSEEGGLFSPPRKIEKPKVTGQSRIDNFLKSRDKTNGHSEDTSPRKGHKRNPSSADCDFTSDSGEPTKKRGQTEPGKNDKNDRPNIFTKDFTAMSKELGCPDPLPENLFEKSESQPSGANSKVFRVEKPKNVYKDENLSKAQLRRMRESARRLSEYEDEVAAEKLNKKKRKHSSDSKDATLFERLGDLFGDNDPLPSTSSQNHSSFSRLSSLKESQSSDEDDSGFVAIDTPLEQDSPFSSPIKDLVARMEYSKNRNKKSRLHSLSSISEDNNTTGDLLEGLDDEFENDLDESSFEVKNEEEAVENEEEEAEEEEEEEEYGMLALRGPLLQIPTSKSKTYTVADLDEDKVVKGPYKNPKKMHFAMFLHQSMKEVIGDPHTLDFEPEPPYLTFPLLKGEGATLEVTTKSFSDCLSDAEIEGAEFLTRESLGIVQLHRINPEMVHKLPVSFWAHYLFRFALNIGDSGMYNAITDKELSFLYGIDMEENRGEYTGPKSLINIMFTKAPKKKLCEAILVSMKLKKTDLFRLVCRPINYASLDRLAREYDVEYNRLLFIERMVMARQLVAKL